MILKNRLSELRLFYYRLINSIYNKLPFLFFTRIYTFEHYDGGGVNNHSRWFITKVRGKTMLEAYTRICGYLDKYKWDNVYHKDEFVISYFVQISNGYSIEENKKQDKELMKLFDES